MSNNDLPFPEVSSSDVPFPEVHSQTNTQPSSGPISDSFFSSAPLGRIMSAFGQSVTDGWGANPSGQNNSELQNKDYQEQKDNIHKSFNEAFIRPAASELYNLISRAGSAYLNYNLKTPGAVMEQTATELKHGSENNPDPYSLGKYVSGAAGELLGDLSSGALPETSEVHTPITESTLSTARAKGVIGEGEKGFFNTEPPSPENLQARQEAAEESGNPATVTTVKPTPPVKDVNVLARQVSPDVFQEYESKVAYHDQLQSRLNELNNQDTLDIQKVFHGTQAEESVLPDATHLISSDLGPHFSSLEETARKFANDENRTGRVLPATLYSTKTLETPDLAGWNPLRVSEWLDDNGHTQFPGDKNNLGDLQSKVWDAMQDAITNGSKPGDEISVEAGNKVLKNWLSSKGYDTIKYNNLFEGKKAPSFIALNKDIIKNGHDNLDLDTRGQGKFYHGTSNPVENLFDYGGSESNIYGDGLYTTDAADIAKGYTRKGSGSNPTIYQIDKPKNENLLNMEEPLSDPIKKILIQQSRYDNLVGIALDENPQNLREVYNAIRSNSANEGISKIDVQEIFDSLAYNFQKEGYTGLEHKGGLLTGSKEHTVQIHWEPQSRGFNLVERPDLKERFNEIDSTKEAFKENLSRLQELESQITDAYRHASDLLLDSKVQEKLPTASTHPFGASEKPVQGDSSSGTPSTNQPPETSVESPQAISDEPVTGSTTNRLTPIEGTGEKNAFGLSQTILDKALDSGLIDERERFDLPGAKSTTWEHQATRAGELVENDYELAKQIAMGQKEAPKDVLPEAVLIGVTQRAIREGDIGLVRQLGTQSGLLGESRTMGQRIGILSQLTKDDPVSAIREVQDAREKDAMRRKVDVEGTKNQLSKELKNTINSEANKDPRVFQNFLKEIECDY